MSDSGSQASDDSPIARFFADKGKLLRNDLDKYEERLCAEVVRKSEDGAPSFRALPESLVRKKIKDYERKAEVKPMREHPIKLEPPPTFTGTPLRNIYYNQPREDSWDSRDGVNDTNHHPAASGDPETSSFDLGPVREELDIISNMSTDYSRQLCLTMSRLQLDILSHLRGVRVRQSCQTCSNSGVPCSGWRAEDARKSRQSDAEEHQCRECVAGGRACKKLVEYTTDQSQTVETIIRTTPERPKPSPAQDPLAFDPRDDAHGTPFIARQPQGRLPYEVSPSCRPDAGIQTSGYSPQHHRDRPTGHHRGSPPPHHSRPREPYPRPYASRDRDSFRRPEMYCLKPDNECRGLHYEHLGLVSPPPGYHWYCVDEYCRDPDNYPPYRSDRLPVSSYAPGRRRVY